jgi:uncharacterized membrane protein
MSRKNKREALQPAKQAFPQAKPPLIDPATALTPLMLSLQMQMEQRTTTTSANPFPPPDVLAKFDAILPGMAKRVVRMAEDEAIHRRAIESEALKHQASDVRGFRRSELVGQIFGLVIGSLAMLSAAYCGVHGAQWTGSFLGTAGVTGLVTVFIAG